MRSYFCLFVLALFALSCNKNTQLADTPTIGYYLEFDIWDIPEYGETEEPDSVHFYAKQEVEATIRWRNLTDKLEAHFSYGGLYGLDNNEDSILIVGTLDFPDESNTFEHGRAQLEIALMEDRRKLVMNADSTFRYRQLEDLLPRLNSESLGANFFQLEDPTQRPTANLLMTLPELAVPEENWGITRVTSSMFYFPDEVLNISSARYYETSNSIELSGDFAVQLKIPSCGFYPFYGVKNANFHAIIRQQITQENEWPSSTFE